MTGSFAYLLLSTALFSVAQAHIELMYPPAINSRYNKATPEPSIDYSMTTPLRGDGSNWPCKGYNTPELIARTASVATLSSGSTLKMQLGGSAFHSGGSCQAAVSYDGGATFAVIASIIGGCPIGQAYDIPIPALPSATKALFAWNWMNRQGNREDYGNCAVVDIVGTVSSYTGPKLFRANSLPDGSCIVPEGTEVVYPNPGPSVQYGGSMSASSPVTRLSPCSVDQMLSVTVGPSGSQAAAPQVKDSTPKDTTPTVVAPKEETKKADPVVAPVAAPVVAAAVAASPSTPSTPKSSPAPRPVNPKGVANPKAVSAAIVVAVNAAPASPPAAAAPVVALPLLRSPSANDGSSSNTPSPPANAQTPSSPPASPPAAQAAPVPAPVPAPAAQNASPPPAAQNASPPSTGASATLLCTSLTTFSLCGSGVCTPMGNVAPGTICKDGAIAMAPGGKRFAKRHQQWNRGLRHGH